MSRYNAEALRSLEGPIAKEEARYSIKPLPPAPAGASGVSRLPSVRAKLTAVVSAAPGMHVKDQIRPNDVTVVPAIASVENSSPDNALPPPSDPRSPHSAMDMFAVSDKLESMQASEDESRYREYLSNSQLQANNSLGLENEEALRLSIASSAGLAYLDDSIDHSRVSELTRASSVKFDLQAIADGRDTGEPPKRPIRPRKDTFGADDRQPGSGIHIHVASPVDGVTPPSRRMPIPMESEELEIEDLIPGSYLSASRSQQGPPSPLEYKPVVSPGPDQYIERPPSGNWFTSIPDPPLPPPDRAMESSAEDQYADASPEPHMITPLEHFDAARDHPTTDTIDLTEPLGRVLSDNSLTTGSRDASQTFTAMPTSASVPTSMDHAAAPSSDTHLPLGPLDPPTPLPRKWFGSDARDSMPPYPHQAIAASSPTKSLQTMSKSTQRELNTNPLYAQHGHHQSLEEGETISFGPPLHGLSTDNTAPATARDQDSDLGSPRAPFRRGSDETSESPSEYLTPTESLEEEPSPLEQALAAMNARNESTPTGPKREVEDDWLNRHVGREVIDSDELATMSQSTSLDHLPLDKFPLPGHHLPFEVPPENQYAEDTPKLSSRFSMPGSFLPTRVKTPTPTVDTEVARFAKIQEITSPFSPSDSVIVTPAVRDFAHTSAPNDTRADGVQKRLSHPTEQAAPATLNFSRPYSLSSIDDTAHSPEHAMADMSSTIPLSASSTADNLAGVSGARDDAALSMPTALGQGTFTERSHLAPPSTNIPVPSVIDLTHSPHPDQVAAESEDQYEKLESVSSAQSSPPVPILDLAAEGNAPPNTFADASLSFNNSDTDGSQAPWSHLPPMSTVPLADEDDQGSRRSRAPTPGTLTFHNAKSAVSLNSEDPPLSAKSITSDHSSATFGLEYQRAGDSSLGYGSPYQSLPNWSQDSIALSASSSPESRDRRVLSVVPESRAFATTAAAGPPPQLPSSVRSVPMSAFPSTAGDLPLSSPTGTMKATSATPPRHSLDSQFTVPQALSHMSRVASHSPENNTFDSGLTTNDPYTPLPQSKRLSTLRSNRASLLNREMPSPSSTETGTTETVRASVSPVARSLSSRSRPPPLRPPSLHGSTTSEGTSSRVNITDTLEQISASLGTTFVLSDDGLRIEAPAEDLSRMVDNIRLLRMSRPTTPVVPSPLSASIPPMPNGRARTVSLERRIPVLSASPRGTSPTTATSAAAALLQRRIPGPKIAIPDSSPVLQKSVDDAVRTRKHSAMSSVSSSPSSPQAGPNSVDPWRAARESMRHVPASPVTSLQSSSGIPLKKNALATPPPSATLLRKVSSGSESPQQRRRRQAEEMRRRDREEGIIFRKGIKHARPPLPNVSTLSPKSPSSQASCMSVQSTSNGSLHTRLGEKAGRPVIPPELRARSNSSSAVPSPMLHTTPAEIRPQVDAVYERLRHASVPMRYSSNLPPPRRRAEEDLKQEGHVSPSSISSCLEPTTVPPSVISGALVNQTHLTRRDSASSSGHSTTASRSSFRLQRKPVPHGDSISLSDQKYAPRVASPREAAFNKAGSFPTAPQTAGQTPTRIPPASSLGKPLEIQPPKTYARFKFGRGAP